MIDNETLENIKKEVKLYRDFYKNEAPKYYNTMLKIIIGFTIGFILGKII